MTGEGSNESVITAAAIMAPGTPSSRPTLAGRDFCLTTPGPDIPFTSRVRGRPAPQDTGRRP
jgi:hypothetical protein